MSSVATTITEREPEFDQFDREHFQVLAELEADTCPGCGGLLSETTGAAHGYDVEHATCWRCYALDTRRAELAKAAEEKGSTVIPTAERWYAARLEQPPTATTG